jgi:hypothetical protein
MAIDAGPAIPGQKKRINWSNIALGGIMNMFEVRSTIHTPAPPTLFPAPMKHDRHCPRRKPKFFREHPTSRPSARATD